MTILCRFGIHKWSTYGTPVLGRICLRRECPKWATR